LIEISERKLPILTSEKTSTSDENGAKKRQNWAIFGKIVENHDLKRSFLALKCRIYSEKLMEMAKSYK